MSSNSHDSSSDETEPRTTPNTTLLNAHNVKKYFTSSTGFFDNIWGDTPPVKAVDGVDISVKKKETVGLVGESGCGKTTLGRTLARLYAPTDGHIEFDGENITNHSGKQLKQLRKNIQIIFQDPQSSLNPRKTVGEIVEKPLSIHNLASDNTRERVIELFEQVGLQESHLDRYPHEFSGGQRQRVGIARALAVEPQLIVADEPVSALDVSVQAQIINLMQRLQDEYDLSYIFIAHDLSVVKHISDRVAVMYLGKIIEKGPTHDIFTNPQHPYTRALLQAIPSVEAERTARENVLEGNPPSPIDSPSGCPFHTRCPEFIGDECVAQEPELDSVAESSGAIAPPDTIARTVPDDTVVMDDDRDSHTEHTAACHWLHKSAEERRQQAPLTHTALKSDSTYSSDDTSDVTDKTESQ